MSLAAFRDPVATRFEHVAASPSWEPWPVEGTSVFVPWRNGNVDILVLGYLDVHLIVRSFGTPVRLFSAIPGHRGAHLCAPRMLPDPRHDRRTETRVEYLLEMLEPAIRIERTTC